MPLELNNHVYYANFYLFISLLFVFLWALFYLRFFYVNKKLKNIEGLSKKQVQLLFILFISSIPFYVLSKSYDRKARFAETVSRYGDSVLNATPQYSCATYIGMKVTSVTGGRPTGPLSFRFEDDKIKRGYDQASPILVNSLEKGAKVCVKYLSIPAGAEMLGADGKRILEVSNTGSLGECNVNKCRVYD